MMSVTGKIKKSVKDTEGTEASAEVPRALREGFRTGDVRKAACGRRDSSAEVKKSKSHYSCRAEHLRVPHTLKALVSPGEKSSGNTDLIRLVFF